LTGAQDGQEFRGGMRPFLMHRRWSLLVAPR
jgi:hypothetical protein